MARIKRGLMRHKRHKKVIGRAKGFYGRKKNTFKNAQEQLMKSGQYAFRDRRVKKREFRRLWIARISAACNENGIKYSQLIYAMSQKGIDVNRKVLSEMAIHDAKSFTALVESVRQ